MDERLAYRDGHPPACTCVACSERRIRGSQKVSLWRRLAGFFKLRR